jgi:hypothetical protein
MNILPLVCQGTGAHTQCKNVGNYFLNKINKKEVLTQLEFAFFSDFLLKSSTNNTYHYGRTDCMGATHSLILKVVLKNFLKKFKLVSNLNKFLLKLEQEDIIDILVWQEVIALENNQSLKVLLSADFINLAFNKYGLIDYIINNYFCGICELNALFSNTLLQHSCKISIYTNNYDTLVKILINNKIETNKFIVKMLPLLFNSNTSLKYINAAKQCNEITNAEYERYCEYLFIENLKKITQQTALQNNLTAQLSIILNKTKIKEIVNKNFEIIMNVNSCGQSCGTMDMSKNSFFKMSSRLEQLIFFGLTITKEIVIFLIKKRLHINNIDKYGIDIDNDIMKECSRNAYYPYKYTIKPQIEVLEFECSHSNNITNISYLKELGGEFNSQCLINACKTRSSGRVIKFLIEKCKVKVNSECIQKFEESNDFTGLSIMLKHYDDSKVKKIEEKVTELNTNCVMKIAINNLDHDIKDENYVFDLRKKVIAFFNFKDIKYNYTQLKLKFIEYLISNNLVVGKYFVVDTKLSTFLKINQCIIINCDDIDSILSYFIKKFYNAVEEEQKITIKKKYKKKFYNAVEEEQKITIKKKYKKKYC